MLDVSLQVRWAPDIKTHGWLYSNSLINLTYGHIVRLRLNQCALRDTVMLLRRLIRPVTLILGLVIAGSTQAHHSFAVYDSSRSVTVKGIVTKWQWTNPHAYLEIDSKDAAGAIQHFVLEGTSINIMIRGGWRSSMIKAGDQVTAVAAPSFNDDRVGLLLEVTFANGDKRDMPIPAGYTFKRTP